MMKPEIFDTAQALLDEAHTGKVVAKVLKAREVKRIEMMY